MATNLWQTHTGNNYSITREMLAIRLKLLELHIKLEINFIELEKPYAKIEKYTKLSLYFENKKRLRTVGQ